MTLQTQADTGITAPATMPETMLATVPPPALVPLRERCDGWTPDRQREFLEHLADTGSVRVAASLVDMSEQSAHRLRRRADAGAFAQGWRAALAAHVETLGATALERAVHGSVRRRFWRGEQVGEERVPSDRLLIWLMSRGQAAIARHDAKAALKTAEAWETMLGAIAHPAAPGEPAGGFRVWMGEHGYPLTNLPPGPDFDPEQASWGRPGQPDYERSLSEDEEDAWLASRADEEDAREQRRVAFFEELGRPA